MMNKVNCALFCLLLTVTLFVCSCGGGGGGGAPSGMLSLTVVSAHTPTSPSPGTHYYSPDEYVTASAQETVSGTAGTRYVCTGWTGGSGNIPFSGTETSYAFTITQNCTITWMWRTEYELTTNISPPDCGTITREPDATWYSPGTNVQLTANANTGFRFSEWSGHLTGTANPTSVIMSDSRSVTANFIEQTYSTITVSSAHGAPDPPVGESEHPDGNSLTVSCGTTPYSGPPELPGTRYVCTGWSGGSGNIPATGNASTYTLVVTQDSTITWLWQTQYRLATAVKPAGAGTVTPATGWYNENAVLSCDATAADGYAWVGWSGGSLVGSSRPQNLTMNGPKSVTANFESIPFNLTVSSAHGLPDPPVGTTTQDGGTSITASCGPTPFYETFTEGFEAGSISGWTTGGNANWAATADDKHSGTYSARSGAIIHSQSTYIERLFPMGAGGGSVTFWWKVSSESNGDFLIFSIDGTEQAAISGAGGGWESRTFTLAAGNRTLRWTYSKNATISQSPDCGWIDDIAITNTHASKTRYSCTGYTGEGSCPAGGPENSVTFTITMDTTVTWNWMAQYQLTTSVSPVGGGYYVTPLASGIWYDDGTVVSCDVNANTGYVFSHWSGDSVTNPDEPNTPDTVEITMDGPKSIVANFFRPTLTVSNPSGYDTPIPPVGQHYYGHGVSVTCSVTSPVSGGAGIRYVCTGHTGTGSCPASGTASSVTFTITLDSSITWNWKTQYYLTLSVLPVIPVIGGTVTCDPSSPDGYYDDNDPDTVVQLTATPSAGFVFSNWSGNLSGTENPKNLTMDGPKSVTANFTISNPRTVTVASPYGEPDPPVDVTSYPDGYSVTVSCGPTPYPPAATGTRYVCTGWSGGTGDIPATGEETSYTISEIHNDSTITWEWKTQYQLTTAVDPANGGSVTLDPPGGWYDSDTVVSCTATPNSGWKFSNWSGNLGGATNPQNLTMNGPKTITANFTRPTLTVYNPGGYDTPIPAAGTHTCDYNSSVTCSVASPVYATTPGTFTEGFEAGLSQRWITGGNANWLLTDAERLSGTYSARSGAIGDNQSTYIERTLTIGEEGGALTFWWKVSCEYEWWYKYDSLEFWLDGARQTYIRGEVGWEQRTYSLAAGVRTLRWRYIKDESNAAGSDRGWIDDIQVTNTVVPYTNHVCTGYTGTGSCPSGSGSSVTFTITENSSITWNWKTQYRLRVSVAPVGTGTVGVSPLPDSEGYHDAGTPVTLTATGNAPYGFSFWSGDLTGSENPKQITMDGPKSVTANFRGDSCILRVYSAYGEPNPSVGDHSYLAGDPVTVSCGTSPYPQGATGTRYLCTGWTGGSGDIDPYGSGTSISFTITRDCAITWRWQVWHQLTTSVSPVGSGTVTPASGSWHSAGTVVSCNAIAYIDYGFVGWSGDLSGTERPKNLLMNGPKSITANFIKPALAVLNSPGFPLECGDPNPPPAHSGLYSACSGTIGDSQNTYIERTFTIGVGGGTVAFWWRVRSESNYDRLRFDTDGTERAAISGAVDWQLRTFALTAGIRTLRWTYSKNATISQSPDRGWIDDITVTNTSTGTFTEGFESGNISGWTTGGSANWSAGQFSYGTSVTCSVTSPWFATTPAHIFTGNFDAGNLSDWTTGGDAEWSVTTAENQSPLFCARSGAIGDLQTTYIQKILTIPQGGGTLTFWWKVSSEANYDWLRFDIDGTDQAAISGLTEWARGTFSLAAGTRTLRWRYTKDSSFYAGSDCGWLDSVSVTQTPNSQYLCTGYTGTGSCPSGSASSVTFTITQDSSITWNWLAQHRLTVAANPVAGGIVDVFPPSEDYYNAGAAVTLTASPYMDYEFGNWSGALTGTTNPQNLTMDGPKSVTANFIGPITPSNLIGTPNSATAITWSWTGNSDWQAIAAGVLQTVYSTMPSPLPASETCPRDGSRLLFGTIDVSGAVTYTIAYVKDTDTTWHCTADTNRTGLYANDYYIDQTGALRAAPSTGDGPQANSGSPLSPVDVWFDVHNSAHVSVVPPGTIIYPNITSYQETTGLSENTQYTRHVHAVYYGNYSVPTNDATCHTLVHNATTDDFTVALSTPATNKTIGSGTSAERHPINISYNYARCQMLYKASEIGTQSGVISRIRFQRAAGDADTVNNVTIHMVQTTEWSVDYWHDTSLHIPVYSGNLDIPAGGAGDWFEIRLTTPFGYDGTSNVMVTLVHRDGSKETTYTTWRTSSTYGSEPYPLSSYKCVAGASDSATPDPPVSVTLMRPNIQFELGGTVAITVTEEPPNSTAGSTGVRIERSSSQTFSTYTIVQSYAATYTKTDSVGSGTWWYRIRFRNADGIASAYSPGESVIVTVAP